MKHITIATAADLVAWADRLDAEAQLPRLVRRLIHATAGGIKHIGFPADESTRGPGYDGVLVASHGSAHVPAGSSVWELSTRSNPGGKATEDYDKRVVDPRGVVAKDTAYVAVTLRRWLGKDEWARDRVGTGTWKDVRVSDANDLEQWLELAPAVQLWLATRLGRRPVGVLDVETFWADWCAATTPTTSGELLLAGRQEVAEQIHAWLRDPSSPVLTLQAESREEAVAVFIAAVMRLEEDERLTHLSRMAVAQADTAWRELSDSGHKMILVPSGWDLGNEAVYAQRRGQRIIVPLGAADPRSTSAVAIPKLQVDAAAALLEKQGLGRHRARELAAQARRSLSAFRRAIAIHDSLREPQWGRAQDARHLVPTLLAGSWNEATDGDRAVLAALAGSAYDQLAPSLMQWSKREDPPLRCVGGVWSLLSREDAWLVLSKYVARGDLDRLTEQVQLVLGTPDPKFELPDDEQWWASTRGKGAAHSEELCKGLAQTVALLGTRGMAIDVGPGTSAAHVAHEIVRRLLEAANKDWRIWATLCDRRILPTLAEVAPDQFLSAVTDGLRGDSPILRSLFRDGKDRNPLFSSSPHTDLLWALETLAWNPEYLTACALLLAKLADIDPGGGLTNRPLHSLREIFLTWHPQTAAPHEARIAAIDAVRRRFPSVGWELLCKLLPEDQDSATPTARPHWHQWGNDEAPRITRGEVERAVTAVIDRGVADAGTDGDRWDQLIGALGALSLKNHESIVDGLGSLDASTLQDSQRAAIWHRLRRLLSHHRSFPTADWVIPEPLLGKIAALFPRFEPSDPAARYAWLFTGWPELPEGRQYEEHEVTERAIAEARVAAVHSTLATAGVAGVVALTSKVEVPGYLGFSLGQCDLSDEDEKRLLAAHLGSSNKDLCNLARGFVDGRARRSGAAWVETRVEDPATSLTPPQRAEMLLSLPTNSQTLALARKLGEEGERRFWSRVNVYQVAPETTEDIARALLAQGLAYTAIELLGVTRQTVPTALLLDVMEGVVQSEPRPGDIGQMFTHHMQRFFDRLAKDETIEPSRIATLEWQFIGLFDRREHQPRFLQRELARDPSFFVDVLSLVFRGKDEEPRQVSEEAQLRARNAYKLLQSWRTPPGTAESGDIDAVVLREWVRNARAGCAAKQRDAVGDQTIGQLLSGASGDPDGSWPCLAIREVIEESGSTDLELGVSIGVYNGRGVWSKGVHEGGDQEVALAQRYEASAQTLAAHFPRTAQMLRRMAGEYRRDALRGDQEAERRQDFDE